MSVVVSDMRIDLMTPHHASIVLRNRHPHRRRPGCGPASTLETYGFRRLPHRNGSLWSCHNHEFLGSSSQRRVFSCSRTGGRPNGSGLDNGPSELLGRGLASSEDGTCRCPTLAGYFRCITLSPNVADPSDI